MADEQLGRAAGADASHYKPSDHFLGILNNIIASKTASRVVLPGIGEVIVFPDRGEYYTNVQNLEIYCAAPANLFQTSQLGDVPLSYEANTQKSLKGLLWAAGLYASQGRLPSGCTKYDVIQFSNWPNITRIPVTPNTDQVCALLTRSPTTIMLVWRILGITEDEVCKVYSAAKAAGLTRTVRKTVESEHIETQLPAAPPEQTQSLFRSLFNKIRGL